MDIARDMKLDWFYQ